MHARLTLFAAIAAAGLALCACNQASQLGKAELGDCFRIAGEDSLGAPKLESVACPPGATPVAEAGDAAAETAEAVPGGESAAAATAVAACPEPAQPVACCPQVACVQPAATKPEPSTRSYVQTSTVRPKVAAGKSAARRRAAASSGSGVRRNDTPESGLGIEYARVGEGAYQDYSQSWQGGASYQGGYGQREYAYAPPAAVGAGGYGGYGGYGVSVESQSRQSSAYSEQVYAQSSGYASGGYGGGYATGYGQCCAPRPRGPRGPFDQNGFLTWPGKVGR